MVELFEQYGFKEDRRTVDLKKEDRDLLERVRQAQNITSYSKTFIRKNEQHYCFRIEHNGIDDYYFMTSYFIGVDWIIENELAAYVCPKENDDDIEINYIQMLLQALEEPENLSHLDDLCVIQFDKPYISITQKQDLLSPFLIAQYLQILKRIVRKGLKKSYYTKTENLHGKIKGKVLVARNIFQNTVKCRPSQAVCHFQEFYIDSIENRLLKQAFIFSCHALNSFNGLDKSALFQIINYIHPAFKNVGNGVTANDIENLKFNPIYKEYQEALKLAKVILKRYSYNITNTQTNVVKTPPFWIDMSKLFELYVYKKLREIFPLPKQVIYHMTHQKKEIDFLINCPEQGIKMVVDAKYKPRYYDKSIELNDIRQISAYARMKSIYKDLDISDNCLIDCLIIFSNQKCDDDLSISILNSPDKELPSYRNFYRVGIRLPKI